MEEGKETGPDWIRPFKMDPALINARLDTPFSEKTMMLASAHSQQMRLGRADYAQRLFAMVVNRTHAEFPLPKAGETAPASPACEPAQKRFVLSNLNEDLLREISALIGSAPTTPKEVLSMIRWRSVGIARAYKAAVAARHAASGAMDVHDGAAAAAGLSTSSGHVITPNLQ